LKTLIWRDVIEQKNLIGENLMLSNYNIEESLKFLTKKSTYQAPTQNLSEPSKELVELLSKII